MQLKCGRCDSVKGGSPPGHLTPSPSLWVLLGIVSTGGPAVKLGYRPKHTYTHSELQVCSKILEMTTLPSQPGLGTTTSGDKRLVPFAEAANHRHPITLKSPSATAPHRPLLSRTVFQAPERRDASACSPCWPEAFFWDPRRVVLPPVGHGWAAWQRSRSQQHTGQW